MNVTNLLSATRGDIVGLLQGEPLTVSEIADRLGLTANGIRAHLNALQSLGIVEQAERRKGVKKPHYVYALTSKGQGAAAFEPVLGAVTETLSSYLSSAQLRAIFEAAGERLAEPATGTFAERLQATREVLSRLGATVKVEDHPSGVLIRGVRCPLSSTVEKCPDACGAVVSMIGKLLGEPVEQACKYTPHPMCGVLIRRKTA